MFCLHVCVHHVCQVPMEAGRSCQMLYNWSYRWLYDTVWVLGIESGSCERAVSALSHRAISAAPGLTFKGRIQNM